MKTRMLLTVLILFSSGGLAKATVIDAIDGLVYHLDAAQGVSVNNGYVTSWADQSSTHNDFTNTTAPTATWVSSVAEFNGLPAVQFGGSAMNALTLATSTSAQTIFAVTITTGVSASYSVDGMWGLPGADFGIRRKWADPSTHVPADEWYTGGETGDFAASSGMYVNGTLSLVQAINTAGILEADRSSVKTMSSTSLGGYFPGAGSDVRVWQGLLAEIVVYDRALTETERNAVGYYMAEKYGLSTAYVPEPGTIALLMTGLLGLLAYAWQKRR